MWLINTRTRKLRDFVVDVPVYVILSHTWAEEEVSFQDVEQPYVSSMAGYVKIVECCELALKDGFDWAWIDTCCIDKTSSSALSEAINSMYSWYWQAAICYAFLSDVHPNRSQENTKMQKVASSRWFQRGWTLQELLAPDTVEFYDGSWKLLGTKSSLIGAIETATRIDRKFILNRNNIRSANIGTKLSWAASRQTTRSEDMAYCLLGLVGVNMPMLYGEGDRAFYRLQLEIIRQSNDHTIFAWEPIDQDWQATAVLAPSPQCFMNSGQLELIQLPKPTDADTYQVTNNGLKITLPILSFDQHRHIALLDCQDKDGRVICIWLESLGNEKFQRIAASKTAKVSQDEQEDAVLQQMYLAVEHTKKQEGRHVATVLSIDEIVVDTGCVVHGIIKNNQEGFDTIKLYLPPILAPLVPQVVDGHLLQSLLLRNDEAVLFTLACYYKFHYANITIMVELRDNRAIVYHVSQRREERWQNWARYVRKNFSTRRDDEGDHLNVSIPKMLGIDPLDTVLWLRITTKKIFRDDKLRWSLSIRLEHCACQDQCLCS